MRIPLHIKVHPVVKEFIVSISGSDVIEPTQNSLFMHRIMFILQLQPKTYTEAYKKRRFKHHDTITILLGQVKTKPKKIDPLCRNYLDDHRQFLISRELYQNFKNIFHTYVLAYMQGGGLTQKEAIEDFCKVYNLTMQKTTYEMLKKSWDRSEEKRIYKEMSCTSRPLEKIPI